MNKPKAVIFGYDELLLASIDFISKTQTEISAVVFPSSRKNWRIEKIRQSVLEKGFQVLEQPPRKNVSQFIGELKGFVPDLFFVWSYPMILPEEILEIPKIGCVNLHMGILPEYRGVNGIRWALLNGEEKTGVTIHFMDEGIDTGDVIARVDFPVTSTDTIVSLMQKSKSAGLFLLEKCWEKIISGNAVGTPQNEARAGYYSAKMSPPEIIDWSQSNTSIHNLIRASVFPFPGVFTFWKEHKLTIREAFPLQNNSGGDFGKIKNIDAEGFEITTGKGNLLVTKIELDDREISVRNLLQKGIKIGDKLTSSRN